MSFSLIISKIFISLLFTHITASHSDYIFQLLSNDDVSVDDIHFYMKENGGCLSRVHTDGSTPLQFAITKGQDGITQAIFEKTVEKKRSLDIKTYSGFTALHLALIHNNDLIAKQLIDNKCNLNLQAQSTGNEAPIHIAIRKGNNDVAMMLIDKKSDLNLQDANGMTPLHWAATTHNNLLGKKMIVEKRCNLNIKDKSNQNTPLHLAVGNKNEDFVTLLVNRKCNMNLKNLDGLTPLHNAFQSQAINLANILIERRCDVNIKTPVDESPLQLAIRQGLQETVEALLKAKCKVNKEHEFARSFGKNALADLITNHMSQTSREEMKKKK